MFYTVNSFRRARLAAKMTQEQVAEKIGVHAITVLQWEKGANEPTKKNIEKLAALYGCTVDELLKEGE